MAGRMGMGSPHHWLLPRLAAWCLSRRNFEADTRQLPGGGALQCGELVGIQEACERVVLVGGGQ